MFWSKNKLPNAGIIELQIHKSESQKLLSALLVFLMLFETISGIFFIVPVKKAQASYTGTTTQKILILVHGAQGSASELPLIKTPLEKWGYRIDVFDYTEDYDVVHDSVGGDHWYLHYVSGANGHGDLDLVTNGNMNYSTIIFGAGDAAAYSDVETSARVVKAMFTAYPFLGITRMENGYAFSGSTNNVFQVGNSGAVNKNLTISNPTSTWALEPLKGYTRSFSSNTSYNISAKTSDVLTLESYDDVTPAITLANYASGAKAIYFGFKDWGVLTHVSLLVRVVQQYSGIPYKKPYYSYELDDGGPASVANADYVSLVNFVNVNFGGYPTVSLQGDYLDNNPPANIFAWGQNPNHYNNVNSYNPNNPALINDLKSYNDYIIASHGYQHDRDLWKWTASGLPVDGFADTDGDGTLNWLDDAIETGVNNNSNAHLTLYSGAEFTDPDLAFQESHLSRMRELFDSYGLNNYHVLITPKFTHLNVSDALFGEYGFNIISGLQSSGGYAMNSGYQNGTYVPIRVQPSNTGSDPDTALTPSQLSSFKSNFREYIGNNPLALVTSHLPQMQQGSTPSYELRDSQIPAYMILNNAGYKLASSQSAANKNIGWLWTAMSSSKDSSGNINVALNASAFADGKTRHELDVVMPFTIKQATLGGNYLINVDSKTLYFGKQSNASETVQVQSGTYDATLPRISSVSTSATDVLDATYNSTSGRIALTLSGNFSTDIAVNNFKKPFLQGTTAISSNGNSTLSINPAGETSFSSIDTSFTPPSGSVSVTATGSSIRADYSNSALVGLTAVNIDRETDINNGGNTSLKVTPSTGALDFSVDTWHTDSDYYKKWTESSATHGLSVAHVVGNLRPNTNYALKIDGIDQNTHLSDDSGQITFTYAGGYSSHTFEIEEKINGIFVSPSKPIVTGANITVSNGGVLTLNNLPATITQVAVSAASDFNDASWEAIENVKNILAKYVDSLKLYLKFRTRDGGVSDVVVYEKKNADIVSGTTGGGNNSGVNSNIALSDGDIVKTINNPDVYIIKYKNNKQYRRLILSPSVFKSYGHLKWENLKTISQAQMDAYATSSLVQVMGDNNIYELTPLGDSGERRIYSTETQILKQVQDDILDSVYEINKTDRDSYKLVK